MKPLVLVMGWCVNVSVKYRHLQVVRQIECALLLQSYC
jgi:hypothetical protein